MSKIIEEEDKIPPLLPFFGDYSVEYDRVDDISLRLIPSDTPRKFKPHTYIPVKTIADRNCFFCGISCLVYGLETKHLEMRCRIIIDCVINIAKYTNHDYLMRGAHHLHKCCTHIGAIYCNYSGVKDVGDRDMSVRGITDVFKENVLRIRKLREYSDIWHLHAAANVLNSKIMMLFPEKHIRQNARMDMHRVFFAQHSKF